MRIVFFGAGNYAKNAWDELSKNRGLYIDDYLAFADNNSNLWGKEFCGKKVIEPTNIKKYNADLIVITSMYRDAISKQLIEELGIQKNKIYSYRDYLRKCYADWIYRKRYGSVKSIPKRGKSSTSRIVVYTAITGDYDELRTPLVLSDDITYVCMTNNRDMKSDVWNMEYINDDTLDNVHLARHIKMNPHLFFSDYETSVWVDGKYQIMGDFRDYISLYQGDADVLCFPHPERECICDEIIACIDANKGNKRDMFIQVGDYLREGYPLNNGLYETGCIVRRHNDARVKLLMELWERELLKHSIRDQLSFPYVCWKNNFVPEICDQDINRNPWLLQRRTLFSGW